MFQQHTNIKTWAEDDRPREKLILKGRRSLSDAELIAILIGSGNREKTAVDLAKELLYSVNNQLHEFSKLNLHELCKFKGIGEAKAVSILAALELGRRRKEENFEVKKSFNSSEAVYEYLKPYFQDLSLEEFYIILLNRSNKPIRTVQISTGGVAGTVVDPKVIFKIALEHQASYIILAHNHPSNQVKPSEADIKITRKLAEFGRLVEILIIDHIIYSEKEYYSFSDQGLI